MEYHSVICLASSRNQAEDIVQDLRMSEFSDDEISVLHADRGSTRGRPRGSANQAIEINSNGTGRPLALPPRWFSEMRKLPVPEGGPFVAVGPVLDAYRHEATEVGIVGCLVAMGIAHTEARRVAHRLNQGNILIAVHSDDYETVEYAGKIFKAGLARHMFASPLNSRSLALACYGNPAPASPRAMLRPLRAQCG